MKLVQLDPPAHCDLCPTSTKDEVFDAATTFGQWGWLCPDCHKTFGVGLGTGRGQHYKRIDGKWYKVAG